MKKVLLTFLMVLIPLSVCAEDEWKGYDQKNKRDPFWPLVSSAGTIISYDSDILVSDMLLEGIIAGSGDNSLAIINGKIVKSKDKIGKYVVEKITQNSVTLKKGNEVAELRLKKED